MGGILDGLPAFPPARPLGCAWCTDPERVLKAARVLETLAAGIVIACSVCGRELYRTGEAAP